MNPIGRTESNQNTKKEHLCEYTYFLFLYKYTIITSTFFKRFHRFVLIYLGITLFEIFIFVQNFNFDFPRKIVELFWMKTRENAAVLDFLAVDNFDFTRKIVKTIFGEKLVKMLGFCQNWFFGQKFDFSNSVSGLVHVE